MGIRSPVPPHLTPRLSPTIGMHVQVALACRRGPCGRTLVRETVNPMPEHLPEQDWKRWQQLAPVLLNRFCESVVISAAGFAHRSDSGHEKFLALYEFIGHSNRDVAIVFDNRRRSSAILQIAGAVSRGIMTDKELSSFSEETQKRVRGILAI